MGGVNNSQYTIRHLFSCFDPVASFWRELDSNWESGKNIHHLLAILTAPIIIKPVEIMKWTGEMLLHNTKIGLMKVLVNFPRLILNPITWRFISKSGC
jgi:hypothetical protein